MNGYIGISSKARKMKNIYVGVNGTARQVQKGYIGVNGVAKQFYQKMTVITTPTLSGSYTYSGSAQSASFSNYNSSTMTIGGTYSATAAGTYTATFTPKFGYCWSDESTSAKSVSWTIAKKSLTKPSLSNTSKTYSGSAQSPTINNYNSSWETQSGTASATNASTYTVTWALKDTTNTYWSDGTTANVSATWTIAKAAGYVTLSSTSGSVNKGSSITFTVNSYSGTLSVSSSNTSYATCSISGTTVTVKGVASGSTITITVSAAAATNYKAASATYSIYINYVWTRCSLGYGWYQYYCNSSASGYSQSSSSYNLSMPDATGWGNYQNVVDSDTVIATTSSPFSYGYYIGIAFTSYSFNSSNGYFYPSGTIIYSWYSGAMCNGGDYQYASPYSVSTTQPTTSTALSKVYYLTSSWRYNASWTIQKSGSNYYLGLSDTSDGGVVMAMTKYTSYVSSYSYSKGTYIGTVGSTSSSAFPTNGRSSSDGFWYVYYGTYNSGLNATTVSNSSSSAYPDNGASGSYWYVKQ